MTILSIDTNAKTVKGQKSGFLTGILYLAPADTIQGLNLCPTASVAGCRSACLYSAGRGAFSNVQKARIAKTLRFANDRAAFMSDMVRDIASLVRKASRMELVPLVRLNGTSDIRWERIPVVRDGVDYANVMDAFPDVQFYDYTKIANRRDVPANYDLTFSYSGLPGFASHVEKAIAAGMRVAVVFNRQDSIPAEFLGRPCIDGDNSDLRHVEPSDVVVALYAKGAARRDTSGFVVNMPRRVIAITAA